MVSTSQILPPRLKLALAAMIGAYPLINAILYALSPLIGSWPQWAQTIPLVALMVVGMIYAVIPAARRLLKQ